MRDQELVNIFERSGLTRAIANPSHIRLLKLLAQAMTDGGGIRSEVLGLTLVFPHDWYLSGTLATGSNVSRETAWPASATAQRLSAKAKTPPSGGECTINLEVNGSVAASVSIASGASSGTSPLSGVSLQAGDTVRLNVPAANGAANVTVTLAWSPA